MLYHFYGIEEGITFLMTDVLLGFAATTTVIVAL